MLVNVIRGAHQIGGSIIEVATDSTRIVLDVGSELSEKRPAAPEVRGLFQEKAGYTAVLISHYHSDHIGLLDDVLDSIPVYMSEDTLAVYQAQRDYAGDKLSRNIRTFTTNNGFTIGDIAITPILCDHSAFDSHMLLLEADGEKLLYTGDFRSNGRKDFEKLLSRLPKVDKLVIEGTTLSGNHALAKTEAALEKEAVSLMREAGPAPVFVNMASTNIDRIVTFFRASKRNDRLFLEDTYTASITAAIGRNIPNPAFPEVKVFLTRPTDRNRAILQRFKNSKIGRARIARTRFTMIVRPSMAGYLTKLSEMMDFKRGILIYSLWSGYKEDDYTKRFLDSMQRLGLRIVDLHTSGHADEQAIARVIERTEPDEIIPVHTENPEWFDRF